MSEDKAAYDAEPRYIEILPGFYATVDTAAEIRDWLNMPIGKKIMATLVVHIERLALRVVRSAPQCEGPQALRRMDAAGGMLALGYEMSNWAESIDFKKAVGKNELPEDTEVIN